MHGSAGSTGKLESDLSFYIFNALISKSDKFKSPFLFFPIFTDTFSIYEFSDISHKFNILKYCIYTCDCWKINWI